MRQLWRLFPSCAHPLSAGVGPHPTPPLMLLSPHRTLTFHLLPRRAHTCRCVRHSAVFHLRRLFFSLPDFARGSPFPLWPQSNIGSSCKPRRSCNRFHTALWLDSPVLQLNTYTHTHRVHMHTPAGSGGVTPPLPLASGAVSQEAHGRDLVESVNLKPVWAA